jgi:predicted ATPase
VLYNPVPEGMRGFKVEKRSRNLDRTGSNLAETISRLRGVSRERWFRVTEYLRKINPTVLDIDIIPVDGNYGLRFTLDRGDGHRWAFASQNMSDGTLRALAVLVALFQTTFPSPLIVVGLEEPEAGLHPAAAGVLFDAIMEAAESVQVIVTTHSPDLLDRKDVPEEAIRAVAMVEGRTIIGKVDDAGRTALRERLYTPGELMRMDQLRPEGAPDSVDAR